MVHVTRGNNQKEVNILAHKLDMENNQLIIDLNMDSEERSKSGKTILLASSGGFQWEQEIGISYNIVKK